MMIEKKNIFGNNVNKRRKALEPEAGHYGFGLKQIFLIINHHY